MESQEAYQRARKRVEVKFGFYIHLTVYITVSFLLIIINLNISAEHLWFQWPLMGWGIGVLFHALGVFIFPKKSALIEKMIEKEMKKEALETEKNEDHTLSL